MGETSRLDGQRTCLLKSVSARLIDVVRLTVEGITFVFRYIVARLRFSLHGEGAPWPFLSVQNRDNDGHEAAQRCAVFIDLRSITHHSDGIEE